MEQEPGSDTDLITDPFRLGQDGNIGDGSEDGKGCGLRFARIGILIRTRPENG